MLSNQSLHTLLNLRLPPHSPVLLIYTQNGTERFNYVCEFIFKHVLKVNYHITSELNKFEESNELKINYSNHKFTEAFQILPNGLLAQQGISEIKPKAILKNDCLYFYENEHHNTANENCFHFDIFSAVFYLISRYEEWQSFKPDVHQRFEIDQSCLYHSGFHLKPLIEIWIVELKKTIEKVNPDFVFPKTKFLAISTIDVDNLYAYRSKGLLRTIGAGLKDVLKGDLKNLKQRMSVLKGKKKDPFDIYESVSDFCFEKQIPLFYFFLFKTGDKYNRTVDPHSGAFKPVFKILKENHALFGLHPSYQAAYDEHLLEKELKDLSVQSEESISLSRQHYLRFDIRHTPKALLKNGICADFTMGYASQPGFRAGTSHPFYYYDFNSEKRSDLLFIPFCVMDGAFTIYKNTSPEQAFQQMRQLALDIKQVNGLFISVFHERSFSDHLYPGFGTLYKNLYTELKDLQELKN